MDTFGMEATVEALHEASGYPREEVWLFSFELMHKELKRFDMKRKAEEAELKAAYEKAEREAKAKQKHK